MRARIAAGLLTSVGILIMGMGAYFAIFRPALLPEDLRFIGPNADALTGLPGITAWVRFVFVVLGSYAFTTGLFTAHIAFAAFRSGRKMPELLIAVTGLTSVGVMVAVNFAIRSEFKGSSPVWPCSGRFPPSSIFFTDDNAKMAAHISLRRRFT